VFQLDEAGAPSPGCIMFREWLATWLLEIQGNFDTSHSVPVLGLLDISSPFRALSNASLDQLRWIHRYRLGLGTKRQSVNVLMQLVADPTATSGW
jgi:hypothetical protein